MGPEPVFATGRNFACERRRDDTEYGRDTNDQGQLGDGTLTMRAEPTRVPGVEGATRVVADESYTCARVEGGRVLCWGAGDQGRLGDGGGGARPTPGPVRGE